MSSPTPTVAAERVRAAIAAAAHTLVLREQAVELIALAAVAGEHVLLVGPPGTAKSEVARRLASVIDARWFSYLLGRFTEPSELFGPIDLKRLRDGEVETRTDGMLPEAELAFLDEVFLGSTAILNTLLGILNERRFRRGRTSIECPLRVCVGASNALPSDPSLAAFADRFLVHVFVDALPDSRIEDLLASRSTVPAELGPLATLADVDALARAARNIALAPLIEPLAFAVRLLRKAGVALSDRRIVKAQRLIAAAAALDGRDTLTGADLWPILYVVPSAAGQETARDVLRELLAPADNRALPAAAEDASSGPASRARRLVTSGEALIGARPAEGEAHWRLKLEGVLREIDAGFSSATMPDELKAMRGRLVELVRA